jgi:hypothetical protein
MAKKKAIAKKKTAPKKKAADKKQAATSEPVTIIAATDDIETEEEPEIITAEIMVAAAGAITHEDEDEVPVVILETDLIIELCGPGKRCRQRVDGKFIRQNFIAGRWQQVSGTVFSTLEACKTACSG